VLLADDEPGVMKLLIGEAFVDVSGDEARDFVTRVLAEDKAVKEALDAELAQLLQRQEVLKKKLYGRFGRAINLEER
jgi:prefoldin subunit 4